MFLKQVAMYTILLAWLICIKSEMALFVSIVYVDSTATLQPSSEHTQIDGDTEFTTFILYHHPSVCVLMKAAVCHYTISIHSWNK